MFELAFVMARGQNRFFLELVEALRDELDALGTPSRVTFDGFPPPQRGLVYVLVPPHEYFALHGHMGPPSPDLLARSIFVCAEQPGSEWFERNVRLARQAGTVFDISHQAVREWALRDVEATHLPLGYTGSWDRSPFDSPRDIDVLFLGSRSERRERYLASYAPALSRWRSHLILSDNGRPNNAQGPDFVTGDAKLDLLSRSRVILNLHADDRVYFESLRVVEAIMCGCVVVSEHAGDSRPLEGGSDFVSTRAESLMLVAQEFLENESVRHKFAERAYARLRDEIPLRASAERLVSAAATLDRSVPVPAYAPRLIEHEPPVAEFDPAPPAVTDDPRASAIHRALKQLKLDSIGARRRIEQLELGTSGRASADLELACQTAAYRTARPRVSIIVSLFNYERHIASALDSVAGSQFRDFEVIVVDDSSTDSSLARLIEWCASHPDVPTLVLRHPTNRGLPHARNAGIDFAQGEFVFILDADNEVYPHCMGRLVEALDTDRDAVFSYGMAERFDNDGPLGLLSVGGWNPRRLREVNYIDAMAMIRVASLRELQGYTVDMRLYGWEDYDLWCKVAERGWRGHAVREIVGRYRVSRDSMLASVTTLSATDAYTALIERHPRLMAGVEPPL